MFSAVVAPARSISRALLLALVLAAPLPAADPHTELLAQIRRRMSDNLARLPNYTCVETIERTAHPGGTRHFSLIDRLRLEVAYVGGREIYSWPGAESFEEKSLADIVGRGAAIGMGSFALHARAVFSSTAPEFTWAGEREHDGRKWLRYDFHVPLDRSGFHIQTGEAPVVVPYHGSIEADAETLAPSLLDVRADDLPAELKLRSTDERIVYASMPIGDSSFLLPVSSELSMLETSGRDNRNVTRFEACRQYSGASTVRFDVEAGEAGGASLAPIEVPPGVVVETHLRDAIDGDKAARGDLIYAIVASDVKRSGHVLIPKGALIAGRVTRIDTQTIRSSVYMGVGLLFHSIEFGGRRGTFAAGLESAGIGPSYSVGQTQSGEDVLYLKATIPRLLPGTRLLLRTR
jgi:hypothetical protein